MARGLVNSKNAYIMRISFFKVIHNKLKLAAMPSMSSWLEKLARHLSKWVCNGSEPTLQILPLKAHSGRCDVRPAALQSDAIVETTVCGPIAPSAGRHHSNIHIIVRSVGLADVERVAVETSRRVGQRRLRRHCASTKKTASFEAPCYKNSLTKRKRSRTYTVEGARKHA